MHGLLNWISDSALNLVTAIGIWGVFIGMIFESACIPIPSEVLMLSGGLLVAQHQLGFAEVAAAGVMGNVLGSLVAYCVGAYGGRRILNRYGKYVLFNPHHLEKSQRWFDRYGQRTVFFTRMMPFVRTFISLPAGIAGMPLGKFVLFTFLGCLPWDIGLAYLGYRLGEQWKAVENYIHPISIGFALIVVVAALIWFLRRLRDRSRGKVKEL
ncbi:DedA family protein [Cohnella zeiphila]|uniref:DedA family protein n=1 Tax=Cohnella zeiphila TaxID=2761120 RepID=A0A7X0VW95_9BACL|nr:DedA family protein [Cohnella zeiphila]MBB6732711.1 DedA family protein [Cohnella zeiphila]